MKILFVMKHPAAVRSLDTVFRTLDDHGHRVELRFGGIKPDAHLALQRLADECRCVRFGGLPAQGSPGWSRTRRGWTEVANTLRASSDYLRYLEPRYADAPALRRRQEAGAHPLVRVAGRVAHAAGPRTVRALRRGVERLERCIEPPPHVLRFLADAAPDALVVTHLARDSVQVDYVRAAKRLGIHTVYAVFSWDNLTNKGVVHELPERVLVWNDLQADEAVELHGVPRERVRVLGAWSYDHWFDWRPSCSREAFCAQVGLRADRPIVLYVCSSEFVAPDEAAFVRRWLQALRSFGDPLAGAGVLVRPHPRNAAQWRGVALDDPQARVWPQTGEEPLEGSSRRNYFDSIYHAAAVVGINTSAQIESAIVGRPVHTLLADEFRETQQGTLHFRYLRADEFGHLHVGRTMGEHLAQLAWSLAGGGDDGRNERFLRRFVRPLGLDVAAAPLYVQEVESLARSPAPAPDPGPRLAPLGRLALAPAAALARRRLDRRRGAPVERDEVRETLRRLRRDRSDRPVLALPWRGDEVAELLYWIPFLRWLQLATFGLRDRLVVAARPDAAYWYAGVGGRRVDPDGVAELADAAVVVAPTLVGGRLDELAGGDPRAFQRRRLEFAPLEPPDDRAALDLPPDALALRLPPEQEEVAAAVTERAPTVALDGLGRGEQAAVLARARAVVCGYGPEAYEAVLLGVPAVVLVPGLEQVPARDLRVVTSFLDRPPFGRLHLLEATGAAAELADRALRLVRAPMGALARA